MQLTSRQSDYVKRINKFIERIEKSGGGDVEVLAGMHKQMNTFKYLLDTCSHEQMDALAAQHAGFGRFAKFLSDMSGALERGEIKPPG